MGAMALTCIPVVCSEGLLKLTEGLDSFIHSPHPTSAYPRASRSQTYLTSDCAQLSYVRFPSYAPVFPTTAHLALRNTFLTQLMSIARFRKFLNTLTKMPASQKGMNTAMLPQGDDALALVDILDQVSRQMSMISRTSRLIPRVGFRGSEYGP